MKKINLLPVAAFCLITAMLLSSCGITKNNDFTRQKYTHFKKGESAVNINHVDKTKKDVNLISAVSDKIEIAQVATVAKNKPSQTILTSVPKIMKESVKTTSQDNIVTKEIKKVKNSPVVSSIMNKFVKKGNTASYNNDGYSLLWVVILILLILWLLAVLSGGWGLGGLIYLLLVIALVLLILWFLHII